MVGVLSERQLLNRSQLKDLPNQSVIDRSLAIPQLSTITAKIPVKSSKLFRSPTKSPTVKLLASGSLYFSSQESNGSQIELPFMASEIRPADHDDSVYYMGVASTDLSTKQDSSRPRITMRYDKLMRTHKEILKLK